VIILKNLKTAIGYDEWEERSTLANRNNYYTFVSSVKYVDFSTCKEVTPSYRQLPDNIEIPPCSGRNSLCDLVLNNKYMSIPTGSEDFSFQTSRKNIYEEALYKCEDERFELYRVIENNAAALKVLEPIARDLSTMSPEQAKRLRLSKDVDILHIRAIARVYGDQGFEVIELLKKNSAVAIPVIVARLKQKDEEWRRVRIEMKEVWRKVM